MEKKKIRIPLNFMNQETIFTHFFGRALTGRNLFYMVVTGILSGLIFISFSLLFITKIVDILVVVFLWFASIFIGFLISEKEGRKLEIEIKEKIDYNKTRGIHFTAKTNKFIK